MTLRQPRAAQDRAPMTGACSTSRAIPTHARARIDTLGSKISGRRHNRASESIPVGASFVDFSFDRFLVPGLSTSGLDGASATIIVQVQNGAGGR